MSLASKAGLYGLETLSTLERGGVVGVVAEGQAEHVTGAVEHLVPAHPERPGRVVPVPPVPVDLLARAGLAVALHVDHPRVDRRPGDGDRLLADDLHRPVLH